jgi:hypothetical protein
VKKNNLKKFLVGMFYVRKNHSSHFEELRDFNHLGGGPVVRAWD